MFLGHGIVLVVMKRLVILLVEKKQAKTYPSIGRVVMPQQSNYCDECSRLKDIACVCGLSFKEKIQSVNLNHAEWSETRNK